MIDTIYIRFDDDGLDKCQKNISKTKTFIDKTKNHRRGKTNKGRERNLTNIFGTNRKGQSLPEEKQI